MVILALSMVVFLICESVQHATIKLLLLCFSCTTGDGAGVGKGRTVAGIIYENYLLGRKRALW